jgi:hypothetical protein
MSTPREHRVQRNVAMLIEHFEECIRRFSSRPPFVKPGQYDLHRDTIALRRSFPSVAQALDDETFLQCLYRTVSAWGIGSRGSVLVGYTEFSDAIRANKADITALDGLRIDHPQLSLRAVTAQLWRLTSSLAIVRNDAILVPCSKALHHILPELVVPIDRAYTGRFFNFHPPYFQYRQEAIFSEAFCRLRQIATAIDLDQYIGSGWNTSRTKVLDNAIVGFVLLHDESA